MNKLINYIKDSFDEVVNKVSWPTYAELQKSTVLVLVASVVFALVVAVIDTSFDKLLGFLY
jgi:preprotein translocase subunit SecE